MLTDTTLDLDAAIAAMHEVAESLGAPARGRWSWRTSARS
jgi:hypothetical protein